MVDETSESKVVLAMILTIGSQFIGASQIALDDYLLHGKAISPILIVGVKGLW
jgi:hypothetical protein